MKTNLDRTITTDYDAISFLKELYVNGEDFHPEDDAHDIVWHQTPELRKTPPTFAECEKLNKLMDDIYTNTDVDPCEYLLWLFEHEYSPSLDELETVTGKLIRIDTTHDSFGEQIWTIEVEGKEHTYLMWEPIENWQKTGKTITIELTGERVFWRSKTAITFTNTAKLI